MPSFEAAADRDPLIGGAHLDGSARASFRPCVCSTAFSVPRLPRITYSHQ